MPIPIHETLEWILAYQPLVEQAVPIGAVCASAAVACISLFVRKLDGTVGSILLIMMAAISLAAIIPDHGGKTYLETGVGMIQASRHH